MIDHLAIQCADVAAGAGFYDTVLAPLGGRLILDFGEVIGFGVPPVPDFWLNPVSRAEGRSGPEKTGDGFREAHITFAATGPQYGRSTRPRWLGGAEVLHEPREWPEYHSS